MRDDEAYVSGFAQGAHLPHAEAMKIAIVPALPSSDFQLEEWKLGLQAGRRYLSDHPNDNKFWVVWMQFKPSAAQGQLHTYARSAEAALEIAKASQAAKPWTDEEGELWTCEIQGVEEVLDERR